MKIAIIGGGVVGLSLAREWSQNHEILLLEKGKVGRESSYAAAGMLGPIMEVEFNEPEQLRLNSASHKCYPDFINQLEKETGIDLGFRQEGTLMVASTPAEIEELERLYEYQRRLELDVRKISVGECRELEPRISNYISRAIFTASDYQVDNRLLCQALHQQACRNGAVIREEEEVKEVIVEQGKVEKIYSKNGTYQADLFVMATGAWSSLLPGLPAQDKLPIRPVKGQALAISLSDPPEINHVVRSPDVYCVPKADGRMVIGSTMEEEGYDKRVTAGGVLDLLHKAYEILPFIYEQELLETWAGLRPATRDAIPVLGPSSVTENLLFATGHFRNGILLTPITVKLLTEWLETGNIPELMQPFQPDRF